MRTNSETPMLDHVDALMAWWTLGGVDAGVSEAPVNWLAPAAPQNARQPATAAAASLLPDSLDAFHAWLEHSADLPEASWNGPRILPAGPAAPRLMVVLDMPDAAGSEGMSRYLDGDADRLLIAMLAAIGLKREEAYICALAVRRPAGGIIAPEIRSGLAARMRHHIALVAPTALLLLGDETNRAMMAADTSFAGGILHAINHAGGTVPSIATFHPRLMLTQPSAKAECWKALQLVNGVWA
jgi:uracil-DNA glycosylase